MYSKYTKLPTNRMFSELPLPHIALTLFESFLRFFSLLSSIQRSTTANNGIVDKQTWHIHTWKIWISFAAAAVAIIQISINTQHTVIIIQQCMRTFFIAFSPEMETRSECMCWCSWIRLCDDEKPVRWCKVLGKSSLMYITIVMYAEINTPLI